MDELLQVLPAKSRDQVKRMVLELRDEGLVRSEGVKRWTRWFPGVPLTPAMGGNHDDGAK